MKIHQEFFADFCAAYFGSALLKIVSSPFINSFPLTTIAFSAVAVSLGTSIGKKGMVHFFECDLDQPFAEIKREHLVQVSILVACGTAALFMTQAHSVSHQFPRFTRLRPRDCFTIGVFQGLCVAAFFFWRFFKFPKISWNASEFYDDPDPFPNYEEITYVKKNEVP